MYRGRGSRYICPQCGRKYTFTRYVNTYNNEYVNERVGKCNRLDKCGYHYTPKQYFEDNPWLKDNCLFVQSNRGFKQTNKQKNRERPKRLRDHSDRETSETKRSLGQWSISSSLRSHGLKKNSDHNDRETERSLRQWSIASSLWSHGPFGLMVSKKIYLLYILIHIIIYISVILLYLLYILH